MRSALNKPSDRPSGTTAPGPASWLYRVLVIVCLGQLLGTSLACATWPRAARPATRGGALPAAKALHGSPTPTSRTRSPESPAQMIDAVLLRARAGRTSAQHRERLRGQGGGRRMCRSATAATLLARFDRDQRTSRSCSIYARRALLVHGRRRGGGRPRRRQRHRRTGPGPDGRRARQRRCRASIAARRGASARSSRASRSAR